MSTEQVHKRLENQKAILDTLHFEGPLQRGELSAKCGIRKSSITGIVAGLLENGILEEVDPGRYRSAIALDTATYYALAASVTPRDVSFARVFLNGKVEPTARKPIQAQDSPSTIVDHLAEGFAELKTSAPDHVLGMGVAIPGIIDPQRGTCLNAVNLYQWTDVPLGAMLLERLGTTVHVDNDVRCQLQACTWFDRLARDAENAIYLLIHDGVACSIMSRGHIIIGEGFSAGEIGHITVGEEGRLCTCGRADCLETYCSLPAILHEINTVCPQLELKTARNIAEAIEETPAVRNVLERIARRLARALAGIVAATDPAALVLGTADRAFSECLRPHLQRSLYSEMIGLRSGDAQIITAGDAETGSLRGIAAQVIQHRFQCPMVHA